MRGRGGGRGGNQQGVKISNSFLPFLLPVPQSQSQLSVWGKQTVEISWTDSRPVHPASVPGHTCFTSQRHQNGMGSYVFQGPLHRLHVCDLHLCPPLFLLIPQTEHADRGWGWGGGGQIQTKQNYIKEKCKKKKCNPILHRVISPPIFFHLPVKKLPLLTVSIYHYNPRSHDKYTQKTFRHI